MSASSPLRSPLLACALALVAIAAAWSPAAADAVTLQPGFTESVVFSGMTEPTDVAFAPDGRVFVSEKSGLIKTFANLNATSSTISADLRTQVYNFWDRGLLGMTLDPNFTTTSPAAEDTASSCGDRKRPCPVSTRTLRCFAMPASPLVSWPTTFSL
jgi:glucose/arabinose dehydrogenase